jgi:hypothetical protein
VLTVSIAKTAAPSGVKNFDPRTIREIHNSKGPATDEFMIRPYFPPTMTPQRAADIRRAGTMVAEADISNPFAQNRATFHMRRGLADPADVIKDARAKLAARGLAKASEP